MNKSVSVRAMTYKNDKISGTIALVYIHAMFSIILPIFLLPVIFIAMYLHNYVAFITLVLAIIGIITLFVMSPVIQDKIFGKTITIKEIDAENFIISINDQSKVYKKKNIISAYYMKDEWCPSLFQHRNTRRLSNDGRITININYESPIIFERSRKAWGVSHNYKAFLNIAMMLHDFKFGAWTSEQEKDFFEDIIKLSDQELISQYASSLNIEKIHELIDKKNNQKNPEVIERLKALRDYHNKNHFVI